MKRFLSTVAFCVFLLIFGSLVLLPPVSAEKNLLQKLLNLPAPPPPNPYSAASVRQKELPPEFLDKSKPPADDAPIEDLMAYWEGQSDSYRELGYNIKPSERSLQRILSEIEGKPEKLANFLNILPENSDTANFVKRIYDGQSSREDSREDAEEEERDGRLKKWLTYHSKYFSDDLLKTAEKVGDANEYVTNQGELLALARVDWEKARPILDRLYNDSRQPVSQTLARWAFYRHALDEDSSADIEKYRSELKTVVENKSATDGMRDLAFDALVKEKEWSGLDDWYQTLLEDETLADLRVNGTSYTGLTTIMFYSPPEKRLERMLQLVQSNNPNVRRAAVRNLVLLLDSKNPEVVRALLPWLENPEWAQEVSGERRRIIAALTNIKLPESVPGLIAVLNEKQTVQNYSSNMMMNSNTMAMNVNRPTVVANGYQYDYAYRSEAVSALAMQKDFRAIAPLRDILQQVEGWQIGNVVRALLASGGFSIPEQVEALELTAKNYGRDPGNVDINETPVEFDAKKMPYIDVPSPPPPPTRMSANSVAVAVNSYFVNRLSNPADIKPILGQQIASQTEPDESLVTALVARIRILDEKDPPTAYGLRKIMLNWRGAAINAMLMRDVRDNKAEVDTVVKLLSLRKDLRENQWNDIADMRNGSPTAFGISTCFMENPSEYDGLLQSENVEAKTAMLACARLIRASLPVAKVAENLKSPNKTLALAAERYLETEDSPAAQNFVLAMHPNEAKILGAKKVFLPDDAPATSSSFLPALFASIESLSGIENYYYDESADDLAGGEKRLQKELKEDAELLGVYTYDDNFIRIYKDKAVFSWQSDKARFRERDLSKEEFEGFKNYLASENVNELPPFYTGCEESCEEKELLMLGRNGGRRIYLLGDESPKFFGGLANIFERMREPPAKLRYALEKKVKGLEILFEDENLNAETVWKNGADFRVLTSDAARREQIDKELQKQEVEEEKKDDVDYEQLWTVRRTRRARREYENFAWHRVVDGKLGDLADQPGQVEFIQMFDGSTVPAAKGQWKARTATFEIRADAEGLYKVIGGRATKIAEGYYDNPIVTPNGRWAIATKFGDEGGAMLSRVNLATRKQFPVKFDAGYYPRLVSVAYLPATGKVLIFKGVYSEGEGESEEEEDIAEVLTQPNGEFYLLDAETGAIEKAKGEVRPLAQQTFRPLQTTGKPDEFWAAIPDAEKEQTEVGVYNAKTLTFKSLLKIPQIEFNSMQMWVDADKVYFVYQGHLLSLPMPK